MKKPQKSYFNDQIVQVQKRKKKYFAYGSVWAAKIVEVKAKSLIIEPLEELLSAEENNRLVVKKAQQVFGKEKPKKTKTVYNYPYKASYEK